MKVSHYSIFLLCTTLFASAPAGAQPPAGRPRALTSRTYNEQLAATDLAFRRAIRGPVTAGGPLESNDYWTEVTIPLVFHVLHRGPDDRATEEQILTQIERLNEHFAAASLPGRDERDPDGYFRRLATDTRIRFCRAATDPTGRPTAAVLYRQLGLLGAVDLPALKRPVTGSPPWDPGRYLNIWVTPLPRDNSGYAQFPGGAEASDGIVIDPHFFGSGGTAAAPYDGGTTLTHLIGNYLGLSDLWAGTGCGDDGVADTPIHNAPNFGRPGPGHISTCRGYPREMTMNFMDNTDDAAQYLFTPGQAARMRAVLATGGLRNGLANENTACASGFISPTPYVRTAPAVAPVVPTGPATEAADLTVWPNPAVDAVRLTLRQPAATSTDEATVTILDQRGRRLAVHTVTADSDGRSQWQLSVRDWPAGVYLVRIDYGSRRLARRLIVQ